MSNKSSKANKRLNRNPYLEGEEEEEGDQSLEVFNPEETDGEEVEAEDLLAEDKEEESEEPPEDIIQIPDQQWHVILCSPDSYPQSETFDYPHLLVRWIIDRTRAAARLGELASWRVFVFKGQKVDLAGDLATGELYLNNDGEYVTAAQFDEDNPPPILHNGQTMPGPRMNDSGGGQMPGQPADNMGFDESDTGW